MLCLCSKAGISDIFEGHHGPVTGIDTHTATGQVWTNPDSESVKNIQI